MERIPGAGNLPQKELLNVDDVASWGCWERGLPCMKVGRAWRLRREALEEFMRQSGCPETPTGRVSNFLEVGACPLAGAASDFVRFGA